MQLDIINKLYSELSQFATAKTARELVLEGSLRDARFWSIIKLLSAENEFLAIYLVKLVTNTGTVEAYEYVTNIDANKANVTNPLQIWEKI
jgi:hypothetical protein